MLNNVFEVSKNSRKTDIHPFDSVRNIDEYFTLLSKFLNVETRSWIIGYVSDSCKSIKAVSHCNIECFSENAISVGGVGDNLCVSPAHVKDRWVFNASC